MSIRINSFLKRLYLVCMVSLVVPAISLTIVRSSPASALSRDDFPTLGCPMIAIFGNSFSTSASWSLGISAVNASSNSPVPLPLIEDRK